MPKKKKVIKIENITPSRPPIVTVMGHVDHGKTTLLDAIRQTDVAGGEYGGITQAIGAHQVEVNTKEGKQKITFIDTPGHEAFEKMRSRGASVTDIAVIVIDGVDGVMPQTLESIKHCQAASVPFIIAINKMDLPDAMPEKVKKQLSRENILVEGMGGDVVCVPVSAKTKQGIDALLEMILLSFQLKGVTSDPQGPLDAIIIESKLDMRKGPVASVIIKNGTLKQGDEIFVEEVKGKVKAMVNDKGEIIKTAPPGTPVEVLGFEKTPTVGGKIILKADQIVMAIIPQEIKTFEMKLAEIKPEKLSIVLKADTNGSLEAIERSLPLETIEILKKGVGDISESDVLSAKASKGIVVGFNVKVSSSVKKLAENEKILVNSYQIIYQLLEDVIDAAQFVNAPKETEKILGKAKIITSFPTDKYSIAGAKVLEGRIAKNDLIKIIRNKEELFSTKISSIRHGKEDVGKADGSMEFGAIFDPQVDFSPNDVIISYRKLV